MIFLEQIGRDDSREALAVFLSTELQALLGPEFGAADREEIARAVAAFCAERHGSDMLPDAYLALLLSRALAAAGQYEAGGKILSERIPFSGLDASGRVAAGLPCSGSVLAALSAGILRVGRDGAGLPAWTLDCERLAKSQSVAIEMLYFASVRALVEEVGVTWDASSGAGSLRLAGIEAAGVPADHVNTFVARILERLASARGWANCPALVSLNG